MSFFAWIILGLISGIIASRIVNHRGAGLVRDILLGVVGALVGGFGFTAIGQTGVTGLNVWSIFVSVVGAVIVLGIGHAIASRHP
jgi:uncharacterized membrane protein YeaQ/YmgE (transglycosylase-associated protein family)